VGDLENQKWHLFSGCEVGGSEPSARKVVKDDSRLVSDPEARRCCKAGSVGVKARQGESKAARLMWNQPGRQEAPSLLSSAGDPEPAHRVSNNVVSNAHVSGSDVESELIEVHASEPARDAVQNLNVAFTCRK
jgi:hypothetical protein